MLWDLPVSASQALRLHMHDIMPSFFILGLWGSNLGIHAFYQPGYLLAYLLDQMHHLPCSGAAWWLKGESRHCDCQQPAYTNGSSHLVSTIFLATWLSWVKDVFSWPGEMAQQMKTIPRTQTVDGEQVVLRPPYVYHVTCMPTCKHTYTSKCNF